MLTPKERFLNTINRKSVDRPPTFLSGCLQSATFETMNHINIFFPNAHRDPKEMAKLSIASYKYTGIECVGVPFDLTIETEILGGKVLWKDEKDFIPIAEPLLNTNVNVEKLVYHDDLSKVGRVPVILEALELINTNVNDSLPIAAGITGPFTLAQNLIGATKFFEMLYTDPEVIKNIIAVSTETLIKYIALLQDKYPDVLTISEPVASGTLINSALFEEFVSPSIKKIVNATDLPIMLHICGKSFTLISNVIETGVDVFSIDENVDIVSAKKVAGKKLLFSGNISPAKTLLFGSETDVINETIRVLKGGMDILAAGCGIPAETPNKNLQAMVNTTKQFTLLE